MPSPNRRVGLILDESMTSAFEVLRAQAGSLSEAGLARKAVFEGVVFTALVREARAATSSQDAALRLLHDMRRLLDTLTLPPEVKSVVSDEIDRVSHDSEVQERRRRQRALLALPNPHGRAARELADDIDAFDSEPG